MKFKNTEEIADLVRRLVVAGCTVNANCLHVGPGPAGEVPSFEGLSKGFYPIFMRISEKTTGNAEQLSREARLGIEPVTSRLPV